MTLPRITPTEREPLVGSAVWYFYPTSHSAYDGPFSATVTHVGERDAQDHAIVRASYFAEGFSSVGRTSEIRLFELLSPRQREQLCKAEVVAWAEWKPRERGRMPTDQDEPKEPEHKATRK